MRYPKGFKTIQSCSICNKIKRLIAHNLCCACYSRTWKQSHKILYSKICKNSKCNQPFKTFSTIKVFCCSLCQKANWQRNYNRRNKYVK